MMVKRVPDPRAVRSCPRTDNFARKTWPKASLQAVAANVGYSAPDGGHLNKLND
jgi:hypothetical protein